MPPAASGFSFVVPRDHGPVSRLLRTTQFTKISTTFQPIAILGYFFKIDINVDVGVRDLAPTIA